MRGFGQSHRCMAMVWLLFTLLAGSCTAGQMRNQPKYKTFDPNPFFDDGLAARPLPDHTVARLQAYTDTLLYEGTVNGAPADLFPMPITLALLNRGRERYNIFCSPCHGYDGYGQGVIVQRGFSPPPSFHIDRLRAAPNGHYFNVISNGIGAMYSYGARIRPDDRWAIIAYIRALQTSQNAHLEDVPAADRQQLTK